MVENMVEAAREAAYARFVPRRDHEPDDERAFFEGYDAGRADERSKAQPDSASWLSVLFDTTGCDCDGGYKDRRDPASHHASDCPTHERWDAFVEEARGVVSPPVTTPEGDR